FLHLEQGACHTSGYAIPWDLLTGQTQYLSLWIIQTVRIVAMLLKGCTGHYKYSLLRCRSANVLDDKPSDESIAQRVASPPTPKLTQVTKLAPTHPHWSFQKYARLRYPSQTGALIR